MANIFDGPPALAGDEQRQLESLYRYLQVMSDQLNESMNNITLANFAPQTMNQIQTAVQGSGGGTARQISDAKNALRSMIIKSAEFVQTEMETIKAELTAQYMAVSEQYGTLDQKLTNELEVSAEGIKQNFDYYERLDGRVGGNETYVTHTRNFIYVGAIGRDQNMEPIYGVAIGENITKIDEVTGEPYMDDNAKVATFTKDRLSFWRGNSEIAYFSNRKLYIYSAEVLNTLKMGKYVWKIQTDGSMGLTYDKSGDENDGDESTIATT